MRAVIASSSQERQPFELDTKNSTNLVYTTFLERKYKLNASVSFPLAFSVAGDTTTGNSS
jgi:hypothetical protein